MPPLIFASLTSLVFEDDLSVHVQKAVPVVDGGLTTADPDESPLSLDELGDPLGDLHCDVVDLDVALVNIGVAEADLPSTLDGPRVHPRQALLGVLYELGKVSVRDGFDLELDLYHSRQGVIPFCSKGMTLELKLVANDVQDDVSCLWIGWYHINAAFVEPRVNDPKWGIFRLVVLVNVTLQP